MQDLQPRANLCNALFITRNEQVSGSSPLVGSLFCRHLQENIGRKVRVRRAPNPFDANPMSTGYRITSSIFLATSARLSGKTWMQVFNVPEISA
jgi:hypothetical protein